jgi:hypothetical protein
MSARAAWLACICLACAAAAGSAAPLTEEDVVRLFVAGVPIPKILAEIDGREVAFTLDAEMLGELRAAGLPESLLTAMLERQAQTAAPQAEPVEPAPVAARFHPLTVLLALEPAMTPPVLRTATEAPGARIDDVALFLACVSPTHVPDQWRSHSPLGRDFDSMARHEMLSFVSGARPRPGHDAQLELDIPAQLEVALEPGTEHDLWLGIAVRIDGRFQHLTHAAWDDLLLEAPRSLRATLSQGRSGRLDQLALRFERDAVTQGAATRPSTLRALPSSRHTAAAPLPSSACCASR